MVSLASSIEMEDYATVRSTWFYMETEDVYGSEEQSDLEKAIEVDAAELEPQLADGDVETQQSATSEQLHSDDEDIKDEIDFGEENDHQPNSSSASKDASEAGTTCGSTDETEMLPQIGMQFVDLKAAYSFYSNYARKKGFGVRIDRTNLSRKRESDGSRQVLSKRFVCYKEGFRNDNHKRQRGKEVRRRTEVRVGCPAFVMVKAASNGWVADKFEANHNHPMVFPGQTSRLRAHQNLTGKSYMGRNERNIVAVDCQAVLAYFDSMQARDPRFIYSINVSDDGMVSGIFWADSKARSAYEVFGDVVVFDTMFKTNRYRWPFGPFTGVNHHAQSILFGCGLVVNETKELYEWLFKAWMNAMEGKAPKAIITIDCTGIVPAVSSVFPKTVHRFCSQHITKHALEHLGALWYLNPDFKKEWKQCIYRSGIEEDFLARWEAMMVKYNLKDHSWLNDKFSLKEYWVPCYLRGSFFAGMRSTQRSEGMNSYFLGYFKDNMTLYRFVKQYERAVARRRKKEADAEFRTFTQLPRLSSQSPLEEHAGKVYTRRVFEIFKKHFNESISLSAHEESAEGPVRKFKVGPFKVPSEQRCVVEYNSLEEEVCCSCRMFEFMGLVCKHVLKVLQMVDRDSIPSKYILFRWTKEARCGLPVDYIPEFSPATITTRSLCGVSHAVKNMMAMACSSQECCEVAMGTLQGLTEKLATMVQNATGVGVGDSTIGTQKSTVESMPEAHKDLNMPPPSVNHDWPSQAHHKPPMEQSIGKGKNRCSICRSIGHNKNKCEAVAKETGEPGLKRALVVYEEPSEAPQFFIRFGDMT
ncbi:protein FAR1-RELATED SEQUENCE 5-like isoform X2 [Macadamia integrifolia]|uniref:protein FAR1-RELATED SEQUENCE 5-like isoform X2 n=1 Tax=Macadamia integrifolia TaxID=60698 RepID=UPI001C4F8D16|nr:protein FAR1-RELATED SEQUENCE 5-like isoform X2 [Macadamia integrifolia]